VVRVMKRAHSMWQVDGHLAQRSARALVMRLSCQQQQSLRAPQSGLTTKVHFHASETLFRRVGMDVSDNPYRKGR
jgi:hypothetical protein